MWGLGWVIRLIVGVVMILMRLRVGRGSAMLIIDGTSRGKRLTKKVRPCLWQRRSQEKDKLTLDPQARSSTIIAG